MDLPTVDRSQLQGSLWETLFAQDSNLMLICGYRAKQQWGQSAFELVHFVHCCMGSICILCMSSLVHGQCLLCLMSPKDKK